MSWAGEVFEPKRELNPSQLAAVTAIEGPVLVIAGAGSGKTRVIEYRVLYLIKNGVRPESILLLTFTRKAAREMLSRAARHDPRCQNVDGGTFHSFAFRSIKRYGKFIGIPERFSVLDEGDAEEAIHKCCTRLGFFEREKRFPRKDTLRTIISMATNKAISIEDVLRKEYPHFLGYAKDIAVLTERYTQYKRTSGYMDYDDLLIYLRHLLKDERIRERFSKRYQFIMVDEYQDTNRLQGEITYLLGQSHGNVMVVGDDAQSIYGFRGTSHRNIMEFPRLFPRCKLIKLEENYRSTQSILNVGNAVLENMQNKYSKCLRSARRKRGDKPQILAFKDSYEEAEWIAKKIKGLRDEGIALAHQGVLFRSSYISIPLQAELGKRDIPYQLFGGLKFYETAHVKDLMAYLKVIANPRDELAWGRVLMLIEGIGPKSSEQISERLLACPGLDEMVKLLHIRWKRHKYSRELAKLGSLLKRVSDDRIDVGEKFEMILKYYDPILKDKFDDWHLRINDLYTLGQIASRYSSLEELLLDFAIEPPERGVRGLDPSTPEEERPLTLSTIHSAKGLEWDTVFLMAVIDGVLPIGYTLEDEEELEEEHRLFYVAITRAKNRLFLSFHHEGTKGGIYQFNKISRFVDVANVLAKLQVDFPAELYY
jgi:DNA helicase-2/ATP-dependent DNA helicase PcrA